MSIFDVPCVPLHFTAAASRVFQPIATNYKRRDACIMTNTVSSTPKREYCESKLPITPSVSSREDVCAILSLKFSSRVNTKLVEILHHLLSSHLHLVPFCERQVNSSSCHEVVPLQKTSPQLTATTLGNARLAMFPSLATVGWAQRMA